MPAEAAPLGLVRAEAFLRLAGCGFHFTSAPFFEDFAYLCGGLVKTKLEESMRWTGFRCRVGNRYPMREGMAFFR
jgi:hypothetical protein